MTPFSPFIFAGGGLSEAEVDALIDAALDAYDNGVLSINGETGVVTLDAGDIGNTPAGNIAATTVQAALNELDSEKLAVGGPASSVANTPAGNVAATTVQAAINELDTEKVAKAGDTMTGTLVIGPLTSGPPAEFRSETNLFPPLILYSQANFVGGANITIRKSRGSTASPSAVNANDSIGALLAAGYHSGGAFSNQVAGFNFTAAEAFTSSAQGTNFALELTPLGATSRSAVLNASHANGFSMFGSSNIVVDANRHFRLRSYTIATLPSASAAAGQLIYCSNLGGGAGMLTSNGTSWLRTRNDGYAAVTSNADFTWTPLSSAPSIRHTGTLTADRTVTLSTTNAYAGLRARFTRTGSGAFNLSIGGLKNLATNTWCEVEYDGSAWYLASYGAL